MGALLHKAPGWARSLVQRSDQKVNIVLLALDASGRTTLMHSLELGEIKQEIPTIGFYTESANYKTLNINSLSAGGRSATRPLYAHYYKTADAFIFCFDASDISRFEEVKNEITQRASDELLQSIPVLILANKADKESAPKAQEMIDLFGLEKLFAGRDWHFQRCCALSKEGLDEALTWLAEHITPGKHGAKVDSGR
eukprot:TRINITY_DN3065_c0_g1_i2.p1 TRINITY_DN3065_c0_g1~~TRINITY_DN3065_c0_g1_i2.p1  ORF type:complete len:197 (+),score=17.12 TRINITY_DN3065_c0_g1_i2:21-611(+)